MAKSIILKVLIRSAAVILASIPVLNTAWAQDCVQVESVTTQAQINSFQTDHGPCSKINGRLSITGAEITDLAGLNGITTITGGLHILDTELLTSLDGLQSLEQLGDSLLLANNAALEQIDALAGTAGQLDYLTIYENAKLNSLEGLSGLTDITGSIWFRSNPALVSLSGLPQITELTGDLNLDHFDWQFEPSSLSELDGLENLRIVGRSLRIQNLAVSHLNFLDNVESVGGPLVIENNRNLEALDAFSRLRSAGSISIRGNSILNSINGFAKLQEVNGLFEISFNPSWVEFGGLPALERIVGSLDFRRNDGMLLLDGFSALVSAGGILISSNLELLRVPAFSRLTTMDSNLWITGNLKLFDISGFSTLEKVGGTLRISGSALQDLDPLEGLLHVAGDLYIQNGALNDCDAILSLVDPIDDAEPGPGPGAGHAPDVGGDIALRNLPGCNSVSELLAKVPLEAVNPGLSDTWFWPETNGQGFFIYVFPDIEQMFLGWFTYDTEEPTGDATAILGDPGHRWLTAQGAFSENEAVLDVWITGGGEFNSGEPAVNRHPDGQILLEFSTCNSGTLSYDIPSINRRGIIPIERIILDNVARCYMLAAGERYIPEFRYPTIQQTAYIKAPTIQEGDFFGTDVAISGSIMVVGAPGEDSAADGVDGDQADDSAEDSGAAFVFEYDGTAWIEQAYLKASNSEGTRGTYSPHDEFGSAVAIFDDTIVVGTQAEESKSTGVNGDQHDNSAPNAGAVYVFKRENGAWFQQAYLKASNTESGDRFGHSVDIFGDTIVVGAWCESSNATGVNGDQQDNSAECSGAVYVFTRERGAWSQQAYLKASNAETEDYFGGAVAISGETIIVGAEAEDSLATGVNGDQGNSEVGLREGAWANSGAAYIFVRENGSWSQQAYLKASNTEQSVEHSGDFFGDSVDVSGDSAVVGAPGEDSFSTVINGDQGNADEIYDTGVGAAYVFVRDESGWSQQAYIKPSINQRVDWFGDDVSLSGDQLLVGAQMEGNPGKGIDPGTEGGVQSASGAAFLFARRGAEWSQRAYIKPENTWRNQGFGRSVATTGNLHAVGARGEASGDAGDPLDRSALASGAVYSFRTALRVNSGLTDAWFNPQTDGQGFLLNVFPEIEQVFVGWFTFDTERPPDTVQAQLGDPGHRWLTAQGAFGKSDALLNLNLTSGGLFDAEEPTPGTEPYGELLLEFNNCNAITATYDIPSLGEAGVIPLQRVAGDNVALCEELNSE
jgi:hypothetical protein